MFSPAVSAYRFDNLTAAGSRSITSRNLYAIAFRPDGLQYFLTHDDAYVLERYSPSTAWDVTTSPADSSITLSTSISGAGVVIGKGVEFNGSGSKVFIGIGGAVATEYIEEHALSSAYGGTATYTTRLAVPAPVTGTFRGFSFNRDGTKIVACVDEKFYDVTLSTPYDLSTAGSWSGVRLDLGGTYDSLFGFCFGKTDKQVIICQATADLRLHEYALSTDSNMSTASFVRTQNVGTRVFDVTFGDSGRRLFGVGNASVLQYDTVN